MVRTLIGLAICVMVGLGVELSGVDRWLPLNGSLVPPEVPPEWAPVPGDGRVEVSIVSSASLLTAMTAGLSDSEVALARPGAVALVDGRVFAISGASVRSVLHTLAWDRLPMDATQSFSAGTTSFKAPLPASLTWRAKQRVFAGLNHGRDQVLAHRGFALAFFVTALLLLVQAIKNAIPKARRQTGDGELFASPWRLRHSEPPVRVVLVADAATLAQARTAIGEQHVVATAEHAFAFAGGWILAAKKDSVFELMSELGWHTRAMEMTTRPELIAEGHALEPLPGEDPSAALDLIDALHVCGPLAHGTKPRFALPLLSGI
jgi:hypothetical protein